jgi:glucose-1-phosphate thymidylyltransferase
MKGIILAGGSGTRLHPLTIAVSKQLLPVHDKPMIYYPLSVLMLAGIKEVLIITTPHDQSQFQKLLGDGSQLGMQLSYKVQPSPDGLAQAFILGDEFIGDDDVCLILGDNIFYGAGLSKLLQNSKEIVEEKRTAVVFGSYVTDPERYGVATLDKGRNVISIEEKPKNPTSNYAVVGLYMYPNDVIEIAKSVKPSARGELEITSVNNEFLNQQRLKMDIFSRGFAWLDTGTHEALTEATDFVKTIEHRTSLKISCIEEIAYRMGYITLEQLKAQGEKIKKSDYGKYLLELSTNT